MLPQAGCEVIDGGGGGAGREEEEEDEKKGEHRLRVARKK